MWFNKKYFATGWFTTKNDNKLQQITKKLQQ
jgi:hypothetical protein